MSAQTGVSLPAPYKFLAVDTIDSTSEPARLEAARDCEIIPLTPRRRSPF